MGGIISGMKIDEDRGLFYSPPGKLKGTALLLHEALVNRGLTVRSLQDGRGSYHLFDYAGATRVIVGVVPDASSGTVRPIADNKLMTYALLAGGGIVNDMLIPTMPYGSDDHEGAIGFLRKHSRIVVKPVDGAHGYGVTTNVESKSQLDQAIGEALSISASETAILQKEVSGNDYRLLVIGGETIAAMIRQPAQVVGDGSSTVERLIEQENTNPDRGDQPYTAKMNKIDVGLAKSYLGRDGMGRIPSQGEMVQVVGTANMGTGGRSIEALSRIPDHIKRRAEQISAALGAFVLGVDIIANDDFSKAWLVEVNASPSFILHESPSEGEPVSVSSIYVDRLLGLYEASRL